jgi:hypothetical protein
LICSDAERLAKIVGAHAGVKAQGTAAQVFGAHTVECRRLLPLGFLATGRGEPAC